MNPKIRSKKYYYGSNILVNALGLGVAYFHPAVDTFPLKLVLLLDFFWCVLFFVLILVKTKLTPPYRALTLPKIVLDMVVSLVFIISIELKELILLPLLLSLIYFIYNILEYKSKVLYRVVYLYLVFSGILFFFYFQLHPIIAVIYLTDFLVLYFSVENNQVGFARYTNKLFSLMQARNKASSALRKESSLHRVTSEQLLLMENKYGMVTFSSAIASHDIRNVLSELFQIQAYATGNNEHAKCLDVTTDVIKKISKKLEIISSLKKKKFKLLERVQEIVYEVQKKHSHVVFEINERSLNVDVEANLQYFLAVLYNLFTNSIEACERNNIPETHVDIFMSPEQELIVQDNAGGLDINDIALHKTSKRDKKEHGVFLYLFLNKSEAFGFETRIARTRNGTQFIIGFPAQRYMPREIFSQSAYRERNE